MNKKVEKIIQGTIDHFKNQNYIIINDAIPYELASFLNAYFLNKRNVANHLFKTKLISPFEETWGHWNDLQIPKTYSHYGDVAMDTLLERVLPIMTKFTGLDLVPTYSYARIYKFGDELKRHKDRESCEISCTINLGGDIWPIYLDPTTQEGNKGVEVNLKAGDMLIYKGCKLEHWRKHFEGNSCTQVFLHYNDTNGNFSEDNIYDTRPFLGLPAYTKR